MSDQTREAAALVRDADPGPVAAYYARLQAVEHPGALAAAVIGALGPLLEEAAGEAERVRAVLAEAEQRVLALERLRVAAEAVALGVGPDDAAIGNVVAGGMIGEAAVAVARAEQRTELAYREWFHLFRAHGYLIHSEEPLAVFLTALTRHPGIERVGERTGVYRLAEAPA